MKAPDGSRLGYELTFFRTIVGVLFVHAAITDTHGQRHPFVRRYVRPADARFSRDQVLVRYGEFSVREEAGRVLVSFPVGGERLDLSLESQQSPMLVNGNGVIDMPEGTTRRYYSFTKMATRGTWTRADGRKRPLSGLSWFDHQWGNFIVLVRPWDWFGFQLSDGTDYNLFSFRAGVLHPKRDCVNRLSPDGRLVVDERMRLVRQAWWRSPARGTTS